MKRRRKMTYAQQLVKNLKELNPKLLDEIYNEIKKEKEALSQAKAS